MPREPRGRFAAWLAALAMVLGCQSREAPMQQSANTGDEHPRQQQEPAARADQSLGRTEADRYATLREQMVARQIEARGIRNPLVLAAMRRVPRHEFVPPDWRDSAYGDWALPIGEGQTISQPYIVAFMTEAIDPSPQDRVLDVGTGSGYQAAVLAEIVREVYTIEINPVLAARARQTLTRLGYKNIYFRVGDGWLGWPEMAPFDGIVVAAAASEVPPALIEQLAPNGRLVMPVGDGFLQHLVLVIKHADGSVERKIALPDVRFVPLIKGPKSKQATSDGETSAGQQSDENQ